MCPDRETLAAYVDRRLPAPERDLLEAHLASCDPCRAEAVDLWRLARPRVRRFRPTSTPWAWAVASSLAAALLLALGLSSPRPERPVETPIVVQHDLPRAPEPPPEPRVVPHLPKPEPPRPAPPPAIDPAPPPASDPPPPPPEPAKPAPTTIAALAVLDQVEGQVHVNQAPAKAGRPIRPDDLLESAGPRSLAVVAFPDHSRLELGGDTILRAVSKQRLILEKGAVKAEIVKQPAGQPLVFETPHGAARVLGTVLRLQVAQATSLEVETGRVELRNKSGRTLVVEAGRQATTAALVARPLPKDEPLWAFDFEDGRRPPQAGMGAVERGPAGRLALAGESSGGGSRLIFAEALEVRGDETLGFDYWVDPQAAQVNLHFWNSSRKQTHEAVVTETSLGKWSHFSIRLADLGLRDGDEIGNLFVQGTGSGARRFFVDNLRLTRPRNLKPR